jgi:hypothetical protein
LTRRKGFLEPAENCEAAADVQLSSNFATAQQKKGDGYINFATAQQQ